MTGDFPPLEPTHPGPTHFDTRPSRSLPQRLLRTTPLTAALALVLALGHVPLAEAVSPP